MTDERLPPPGPEERQPKSHSALREALVDERDGPLPAMLLALTVLAGVVDATSILALDHVFVAAMTGNIVFIGLGLSGAPAFSVTRSGLALLSFALGVLLGARTCEYSGGHRGLALRNIAIIKAAFAVPVLVIALVAGEHLGSGAAWSSQCCSPSRWAASSP